MKYKPERRDAQILRIGTLMSNVMFTLRQKTSKLTDHDKEQFRVLQNQWESATFEYLQSFKRSK